MFKPKRPQRTEYPLGQHHPPPTPPPFHSTSLCIPLSLLCVYVGKWIIIFMITYTPRCTLSDSTVRCPRLPPLARCPSALCFHHFKRKLLLLLWQLYYCTHTHTHTQREKSYYYFNNLQLFLVLRCQRRRGANVEGRVIQKQFVEIKFDYIYRPASTSTPSPTLSLTLCSASISRVAFIRSSLAKFFDARTRSAL